MTYAKLTKWFSCRKQPPVRPGWYDVRLATPPWQPSNTKYKKTIRWYFNGGQWQTSPNGFSFIGTGVPGYFDADQWRGLTEKAK